MAKSRTSFKKGEGGRPKGIKNKNYLDVSFWLGLAAAEVSLQKDEEKRMPVIKWAVELIMQKVPALPATPGDSLNNALESQALIKALERDAANAEPIPASD